MKITVSLYDEGGHGTVVTYEKANGWAPVTDKFVVVSYEESNRTIEAVFPVHDIARLVIEHEPEGEDSGLILPDSGGGLVVAR